jgi:serpin B
MRHALGLDSLTPAQTNQGWADLIWLAQSGEKQEISIADSLWLRAGFPFRQTFLDLNRDYFAAETRDLPVDPGEAAAAVNEWVEKHTAGRITELVTPDAFDEQTILALFNTVHLAVRWKHFDKAATQAEPFRLASGQQVDVPMMHARELEAPVARTSSYDAVALSTDGPVTVWIIVPRGDRTAAALLDGLTAARLESLYDAARPSTGSLALPRFTSEYEARDLVTDLAAMGMPRAFSPAEAQFPGIADVGGERLFISDVVQKTFVDFSEQGVEAAAASGAIMRVTSVPAAAFDIRADRPFLFVLSEKTTRAPLFVGLVRDPR